MRRELPFLYALWRANLQAALEYRLAFITQIVGMILNNAIYFVFWVLFFQRFESVGGWGLRDIGLLYGVAASSFGIAVYLFGNAVTLSEVIAEGRLDYYLSLPRPALMHVLASRSVGSGLGDFCYGLMSFALFGPHTLGSAARYGIGVGCAATVLVAFMVLIHSLAFWMGGASQLGQQALNALITFAIYPLTLFDGTAKLILLTILPAGLMGTVPVSFVRAFSWGGLAGLCAAAAAFLGLALLVFQRGLRRYESGSAITVQL